MSANFELTDQEKTTADGVVVRRIRALRDLRHFGVKAGDLGGWVQPGEEMIRVRDSAWVAGEACVYGSGAVCNAAWVGGRAVVRGQAMLRDHAIVKGDAVIEGRARVYDAARVEEHARVTDDAHIHGEALISGHAQISGHSHVYERAVVNGQAQICDRALVGGAVTIAHDTRIWGDRHVFGQWVSVFTEGLHQYTLIGPRRFDGEWGLKGNPLRYPRKDVWSLDGPKYSAEKPWMATFTASVSNPYCGPWANWGMRFSGLGEDVIDSSWRHTDRSGKVTVELDLSRFLATPYKELILAVQIDPTARDPIGPLVYPAPDTVSYKASKRFSARSANAYALGPYDEGALGTVETGEAVTPTLVAPVFTSPIVDIVCGGGRRTPSSRMARSTVWETTAAANSATAPRSAARHGCR